MVNKLRVGLRPTKREAELLYDVLVTAGSIAATIKLVTQPHVHTAVCYLPIWQVVAGVLLAGVLVREYKLRSKE